MNISIGNIIDRYTICKLKSERGKIDNSKEINDLLFEIGKYDGILDYIDQLYEINGKIWDVEFDIGKGKGGVLSLEEVGKRVIEMRDLNNIRTTIKNKLDFLYKEGYSEKPSVIISLTTVPERLRCWVSLEKNLNSLLHQKTNKEYYVIFSIPYLYVMNDNEEYPIPSELLELARNNPRLIINRDAPDYGPIVKIFGGLKYLTDPNDILIACDDDHLYHEEMLEYHVKKINEHFDCAICFNGDYALDKREWIDNGIKKFVLRPTHMYFPAKHEYCLGIPGHWHTVSYKRKFFKEDFNEELFSMADGDDILMGYYLKKHDLFALCVVWDKETDFRPIVDPSGPTPCYVFPIIEPLGFPVAAGGHIIRQKYGGNHGRVDPKITELLGDHSKIYIEKNEE